jgi:hypothetical protein
MKFLRGFRETANGEYHSAGVDQQTTWNASSVEIQTVSIVADRREEGPMQGILFP